MIEKLSRFKGKSNNDSNNNDNNDNNNSNNSNNERCKNTEKCSDFKPVLIDIHKKDGTPISVRSDEKAKYKWVHAMVYFKYEELWYAMEFMWCDKLRSIFGGFRKEEDLNELVEWMYAGMLNEKMKKSQETSVDFIVKVRPDGWECEYSKYSDNSTPYVCR